MSMDCSTPRVSSAVATTPRYLAAPRATGIAQTGANQMAPCRSRDDLMAVLRGEGLRPGIGADSPGERLQTGDGRGAPRDPSMVDGSWGLSFGIEGGGAGHAS